MPECAKTHLQQSRISKFSGGGPPENRTPSSRGGERRGKEGRRGRGKGREGGGKDREGRGGTGRDSGGKEARNGGGGEGCSTWAPPPPPRDKLWIRPWFNYCYILNCMSYVEMTIVVVRISCEEMQSPAAGAPMTSGKLQFLKH